MLTRIVTMTFQEHLIEDFIDVFYQRQSIILSMPGCQSVKLLRDVDQPNKLSTLSIWESDEDLQNYRSSSAFKETWAIVKPMFSDKAKAMSLVDTEKPS